MHITLATCRDYYQDGPLAVDDRLLQAALWQRGVTAEVVPWEDSHFDWSRSDVVVVRSTWNYHHAPEAFLTWAKGVASATRLLNPLHVMQWNAHKGYMRDLERAGVPVIPTRWLARGTAEDVGQLLAKQGWAKAVAKPAIAANSSGVLLIEGNNPESVACAQEHIEQWLSRVDMLLQPFLASVTSKGECSHVFVGDCWSHAFLRQPSHALSPRQIAPSGQAFCNAFLHRPFHASSPAEVVGYGMPQIVPDPEEVAVARAIYKQCKQIVHVDTLPFARVDVVRDGDGVVRLMELELIEPLLHLDYADAAKALASWLLRLVTPSGVTIRACLT